MKKAFRTIIPLWLLTGWGVGLLLIRLFLFNASYYDFLLWNVFLAWVPVIVSTVLFVIIVYKKQKIPIYVLGLSILFWLIFLPNAPYLVTDFVHLRPRNGLPIWYDVMLLFSFALLGLFQFEYSLLQMREVLRDSMTVYFHRWFVPLIILLMSIGIYAGRFLRWNSWEVITNPLSLMKETLIVLTTPFLFSYAMLYIIATGVLLSLFHYLLHGIRDIMTHR